MAGKRQPTATVAAKGKKHLTKAETDQRLDNEVHVPPPDRAVPPKWLPKRLHKEFQEIGEILRTAGLYAELDRDVLGQYFLCRERWVKADKKAAKAINDGDEKLAREWTGVQSSYFKQARQCAESMGLSVTSRCRIVVPTAIVNAAQCSTDDGTDEFTQLLNARQAKALAEAE
jgi:P27 family predicted phage terminase small subunit